jgi:uncharacterized membrane protein YphA (DoxX/SURF4 family)
MGEDSIKMESIVQNKFYNPNVKRDSQRYWVGVIASVILGLILITAGVGKLFMNLPNETEFLAHLAPIFSITEWEASLLAYMLPWVEIIAGILLILQLFPQIVAIILCVPLCLGFAINNLWMIVSGENYEACNLCFGQLEILLGSLTPEQALIFDGVLFILACFVVFSDAKYKLLWGLLDNK